MASCPKCADFTEPLSFRAPDEYRNFVRQLSDAVDQGRFLIRRADYALREMLNPTWPGGDLSRHDLQCAGCGRGFLLCVNVWNGRNWWRPEIWSDRPN